MDMSPKINENRGREKQKQNGGLIVIYHGRNWTITLNKSKFLNIREIINTKTSHFGGFHVNVRSMFLFKVGGTRRGPAKNYY